jgi:hypothetical protein
LPVKLSTPEVRVKTAILVRLRNTTAVGAGVRRNNT